MKITNLEVTKVIDIEAGPVLRCTITLADSHQLESVVPWRNQNGVWASPSNEREHAEICAWLRLFAKSIEDAAKGRDAA